MIKSRPIIFVLSLIFLLGLAGLTNRGESWDEFLLHRYASRSLESYQTWVLEGDVRLTLDDLGGYGPAFVMFDELAFRILENLLPFHPTDVYHLINFAVYLVGLWAFYDISVRWLSNTAAIGSTLLFGTQPVFWGHAFMNSKDIPFLAFFLLSLALGFRMIDACQPALVSTASGQSSCRLKFISFLWLALFFGSILSTALIHSIISDLVHSAALGKINIVSLFASSILTAPPETYIQKIFLLFLRTRLAMILGMTILLVYMFYKHSRSTLSAFLPVFGAGLILGFTISIRVIGPFAGMIVAFYGLRTKGKAVLPHITVYAVAAFMGMYIFWPYLWEDPVGRLFESMHLMSSYPWNGLVLFNGQQYTSTGLPIYYLPLLFAIQFSELTFPLFLLGVYYLIIDFRGRISPTGLDKRLMLELAMIWFMLPILGFMIMRPSLYDNFRQVFFLLPPIFLLAGVVYSRVKKPIWQMMLITLSILPGVLNGLPLHPYEYIYYNRFIGGVSGAYNRFELDYWVTSFRETAEYVNSIAPANSYVWVEGPVHIFDLFVREDLKVLDAYDPARLTGDYLIVSPSRRNLDQLIAPDADIIYTVSRDGVPLAVVKKK